MLTDNQANWGSLICKSDEDLTKWVGEASDQDIQSELCAIDDALWLANQGTVEAPTTAMRALHDRLSIVLQERESAQRFGNR